MSVVADIEFLSRNIGYEVFVTSFYNLNIYVLKCYLAKVYNTVVVCTTL